MTKQSNQALALYYLRLATGFYTLWQAWDMIVHQVQWRAFLAAFPLIGSMAEFWLILGFGLYLVTGLALLTGWYSRSAALVLGALLLLSIIPFGFMTPKVNAVLGPFRAMTIKNLVWLGACLVLVTHAYDPFHPERRQAEGKPALMEKAKFIFRVLTGSYLLWDGLLMITDNHGYLSLMARAMDNIPLLTQSSSTVFLTVFAVIQLLAGLMVLSGIQFKWAIGVVLALTLMDLLGINWHASKGLLRAGGRFMMRDIILVGGYLYFLISGPGMPVLQIKVQRSSTTGGTMLPDNEPPQALL